MLDHSKCHGGTHHHHDEDSSSCSSNDDNEDPSKVEKPAETKSLAMNSDAAMNINYNLKRLNYENLKRIDELHMIWL